MIRVLNIDDVDEWNQHRNTSLAGIEEFTDSAIAEKMAVNDQTVLYVLEREHRTEKGRRLLHPFLFQQKKNRSALSSNKIFAYRRLTSTSKSLHPNP